MKKLNITKEQFNRSRYFQKKYGTLEYVSESGKVYKTNKGRILKFNESVIDEDDNYGFIVTYEDGSVKGFTEEEINGEFLCADEHTIEKVEIKDGVTYIGDGAFENCRWMTSVTFPDGLTTIRPYAFFWCRRLRSVTIPSTTTFIGEKAFFHCDKLRQVTIPHNCNVDSHAFPETCEVIRK